VSRRQDQSARLQPAHAARVAAGAPLVKLVGGKRRSAKLSTSSGEQRRHASRVPAAGRTEKQHRGHQRQQRQATVAVDSKKSWRVIASGSAWCSRNGWMNARRSAGCRRRRTCRRTVHDAETTSARRSRVRRRRRSATIGLSKARTRAASPACCSRREAATEAISIMRSVPGRSQQSWQLPSCYGRRRDRERPARFGEQ